MAQTEAEVARKTDTIMAQADKDGDGVVTFDGERKTNGDNGCHVRRRVQRTTVGDFRQSFVGYQYILIVSPTLGNALYSAYVYTI